MKFITNITLFLCIFITLPFLIKCETKKSWMKGSEASDKTVSMNNREYRLKPLEETTDGVIRTTRDASNFHTEEAEEHILTSAPDVDSSTKFETVDTDAKNSSDPKSFLKNGLELLIMGK